MHRKSAASWAHALLGCGEREATRTMLAMILLPGRSADVAVAAGPRLAEAA